MLWLSCNRFLDARSISISALLAAQRSLAQRSVASLSAPLRRSALLASLSAPCVAQRSLASLSAPLHRSARSLAFALRAPLRSL
jgi:hypothetical protein